MKNENGNALWFILLAVALFGILAAVISRNNSAVDQTGDIEKDRIKASEFLRYGKSVEQAVQKMMLNNGTSENDLDFLSIDADHDNINCTTNDCDVFHVEGGGIAYRTPAELLKDSAHTQDWHVSTSNRVYQSGCDTADRSCTELLLIAKDIPKSICLQINRLQEITNPNGDAPRQDEIVKGNAFNGTFTNTGLNSDFIGGTNATSEAPQTKGKSAACVYEFGGSPPGYVFYQTLLER